MTSNPPQPDAPQYPLSALMLPGVVVYENQADYLAKTGAPIPAFIPSMPVKLWKTTLPSATGVYNVIVNGKLVVEPFPAWLAGMVNIPVDGMATTPVPVGADQQFPIRALLPNEVLVVSPFGVSVQRTDLVPQQPAPGDGFNSTDRALLQSIASKLGIV